LGAVSVRDRSVRPGWARGHCTRHNAWAKTARLGSHAREAAVVSSVADDRVAHPADARSWASLRAPLLRADWPTAAATSWTNSVAAARRVDALPRAAAPPLLPVRGTQDRPVHPCRYVTKTPCPQLREIFPRCWGERLRGLFSPRAALTRPSRRH